MEDLKPIGATNAEAFPLNNGHGRNISSIEDLALHIVYVNVSQNGAFENEWQKNLMEVELKFDVPFLSQRF